MDTELEYSSASAFRRALKAKLGVLAAQGATHSLSELQRQFAYDRALARLFSGAHSDCWVLKGAGALLARLIQARHSKDIDLFYSGMSADPQSAVEALLKDLAVDIEGYSKLFS